MRLGAAYLRPLYVALVLTLTTPAVVARSLVDLQGEITQGGMLIGRVDPGSKVALGDRQIRVSPQGWFVVGFNRDQQPRVTLRVTSAAGEMEERKLTVKGRDYDIQRVDGLPQSKVSPPAAELERIARENALIGKARLRDEPRTDFLTGFEWPVIGRVSGVYGSQRILNGKPKRPHYGVDIAAPTGTPVKAPAPGIVTLVHQDMFYTGGTVNLDHGHGVTSLFIHLSKILVEEGDRVEKGMLIGKVGATGRATGPHLHWGMNWFRTRLDPGLLVGQMPKP